MPSVTIKPRTRTVSIEGGELVRKLSRVFIVRDAVDENAAVTALGIPRVFIDTHPADSACLCKSIKAQDVDLNTWEVTAEFDNVSRQNQQQPNNGGVDSFDPPLKYDHQSITRRMEKDVDGNPILNSAGDPFEPREYEMWVLAKTVTRYEVFFNEPQATAYMNATNSDPCFGYPPETLRLKIIPEVRYRDNQEYFKTTYQLFYQPDGWNPRLLEEGLRQIQKVMILGTPVPLKLHCTVAGKKPNDSDPVSHPVPLDADGKQIDPALLPAAAVYRKVNLLPKLPYAALGL